MKKLRGIKISFLLAASLSTTAVSTEEISGLERVQALLSQTQTLTADVTQVLISDNGLVDETKSGTLSIKRPGKFRWDYQEPYEELLVTDGKTLWMWDADVDSLIERTLDETLTHTPASLLSGGSDLKSLYDLENEYMSDGLSVVELTPKAQDTDFKLVRLGFKSEQVSVIELQDSFDQVTRITLSNVIQNPKLKDELFVFEAPEGVEAIKDL